MVYAFDTYGDRYLQRDITGERFGKLVAVKEAYFDPRRGMYWWFLCDCGMGKAIQPMSVIGRRNPTCGCSRRKTATKPFIVTILSRYWKHEMSEELANKYRGMMQRCYNEECAAYKSYGAKGIKICKEWLQDFDTFFLWSINNGFDWSLTIDRIDPYQGYSPENCQWIPLKENLRRKKRHRAPKSD